MAPVARRLGRLLKKEVLLAPDCVGPELGAKGRLRDGPGPGGDAGEPQVPTRPRPENDAEFGKALGSLCDVYVDDAFAVAHRENASVVGGGCITPRRAWPALP